MATRNKKRSVSVNIDKASESPTKRQRKSSPASRPSYNPPAPRAEPNRGKDASPLESKIRFASSVVPLQQTARPEPENQSLRPSIVLHHKVYPPWQHLPFDKLQDIQLKIAINAHETNKDIVFYAPQSATHKHVAPWKRVVDAYLEIPHKAVIATTTEEDGLKTHQMFFGQDMEEALKHKEKYQHLAVIEQKMSRYWFPEVKKIMGEGSEQALSVKNPFDKTLRLFKVARPINLEACRLSILLETIKEHFRRNSGLSMPEVQNIFLKRTEINIVSHSTTDGELAFEHALHGTWIEQIGVPLENVRRVPRAEACAFYFGCKMLQARLKRASQCGSAQDANATPYGHMTTVVMDVDMSFAGASTVESTAANGLCTVKAVTKAINTRHGLVKLRELVKTMLEQNHSGTIYAAAWESDMTPDEILERLVMDFEIALDVYAGEKTMTLFFPGGFNIISELVLSRRSVEAVVQEWLEPIIALAKEQLRALNGTPAAPRNHQVQREVLMTGFWSQPKCIGYLLSVALQSFDIDGDSLRPVTAMDNSALATLGAMWSMTANGNGFWEGGVTG